MSTGIWLATTAYDRTQHWLAMTSTERSNRLYDAFAISEQRVISSPEDRLYAAQVLACELARVKPGLVLDGGESCSAVL